MTARKTAARPKASKALTARKSLAGTGHAVRKAANGAAKQAFNAQAFLDSSSVARTVDKYDRNESVYAQGDASGHIMYIQAGGIKLSVVSKGGKEAVVAMLGPGDFFGEGCLAGQKFRMGSATAITPTTVLSIATAQMVQLLSKQHDMSDRFITHMLTPTSASRKT